MIRTAYLRIYQPLAAFSDEDRKRLDPSEDPAASESSAARRWLIHSSLPDQAFASTEGAFVREIDGVTLICPWRTRLRMLAGMLAFRSSVPDEVADVFVPEEQARLAADELAALGSDRPEVRSHILHANWHVPLRWFSLFNDDERILTEDKDGLRIRYETSTESARERLAEAHEVLEKSWIDESVVTAVRELIEWLQSFGFDGLVELDYGSVAGMFDDEDLLEDRSAGEVRACIDALASGDLTTAGRIFADLTERWTEARSLELVN
jgi:hypothetical protein